MRKIKYEPIISFNIYFDKFIFNEEKNEWDYLERYNDRVNLDDIFFHKKELGKSIKSLVKNFIIQNYKHLSLDVLDWNDYDEFL